MLRFRHAEISHIGTGQGVENNVFRGVVKIGTMLACNDGDRRYSNRTDHHEKDRSHY